MVVDGLSPSSSASQVSQKVSSKLFIRRIERCKTVAEAQALMQQHDGQQASQISSSNNNNNNRYSAWEDGPFLAALNVCGKHRDLSTALAIFRQHPTESCRSTTISICGRVGNVRQALQLWDDCPIFSVACCHAVMAACGQSGSWQDAMSVLDSMPLSTRSTLTYNVALSVLASSKRGTEAVALLNTMEEAAKTNPNSDCHSDSDGKASTTTQRMTERQPAAAIPICYQRVASALIGEGKIDDAAELVGRMQDRDMEPSDGMVDLIVAAYAKIGAWGKVTSLEEQVNQDGKTRTESFRPWPNCEGFKKVGQGKAAYWKLGRYRSDIDLTIALQPHRNPGKNGIKLLLMDGTDRIGYLLMINSAQDRTSTMLGMYLDKQQRSRGLSKVLMAVWMRLCLDTNIQAVTGVMNKPLLCLVLQHTFGYNAPHTDQRGMNVEISPGPDGAVVVYSPDRMLEGVFCPRDIKRENLILTKHPPTYRGRITRVKSTLVPPTKETLVNTIKGVLENGFHYTLSVEALKQILLGR